MTRARLCLALMTMAVLALGAPALAHWDPGDGHKMHFPQLPDTDGWDVSFWWRDSADLVPRSNSLADDWQCPETGPVKDVHFWVSMQGDVGQGDPPGGPLPFQITRIGLTFYHDLPANSAEGRLYSMPDRERVIKQYQLYDGFTARWVERGDQGWYNPGPDDYCADPNDHENIYQVNIAGLPEPFTQEKDTIYWLELDVWATDPATGDRAYLGWKTADADRYPDPWNLEGHFMDDAVCASWRMEMLMLGNLVGSIWVFDGYDELVLPPDTEISRDLAFVITPEPATLALLGLGAAGLALGRRRR